MRIDNCGSDSDVAGLRYSNKKMMYDALSTDGKNINTASGSALAAISALDESTAGFGDIVTAVSSAIA